MSARMDLNLLGQVFTDYHLVDVGAAAFQLAHDFFIQQDLVIRDAPAGGGNLLVEGVDYTLATEDTQLSTWVTAAVGAGRNVYRYIAVINAAYQAGDLYFSGKYVADLVEAIDHEPRLVQAISGADHTILDDDDVGVLEVDPDGADRTVTLPTVADNEHRQLTIVNSAAVDTTFKVIVDGEGAELINQVPTWWVFPGQSVTLKSNGTIWRKLAGHNPVFVAEDQKAVNTAGGTFTAGADRTRVLNTTVLNEIAGASLAADQITLPPGVYNIVGEAASSLVNENRAKLYNVTGAVDIATGLNARFSASNSSSNIWATVKKYGLALTAATVIELRHRCTFTKNTDGFGVACNYGTEVEKYARVEIEKVV